mgnify:CR=1 FL=1
MVNWKRRHSRTSINCDLTVRVRRGPQVTLLDEPGTRAVQPVLPYSAREKRKAIPGEKPLAYVAVLIGPPPRERVTLHSNGE